MNRQGGTRSRDGRVFSAGEGTTGVVDDSDIDMSDAIKELAAAGLVEILDDEPEPVPVVEPEPVVEEVEPEAVPVAENYEDRTVIELRDLARSRNLPVGGSKDELIARLREAE